MFKDFFYNFLSQCTYNHVESNPAMLSHDDRQHCNVVVSVAPLVDKNRSPMERQGKWVAESCADCGSIGRILHFWSSLNPLASWLLHLPAFLASNNQFAVTATKMCVTKLNTNIFTVPCDRLERTKGRGRCGFAKAINDWVHNRPEHGQQRTTRIEREFLFDLCDGRWKQYPLPPFHRFAHTWPTNLACSLIIIIRRCEGQMLVR